MPPQTEPRPKKCPEIGTPNQSSHCDTSLTIKQHETCKTIASSDANQITKPTLKRYIILILFCLNTGNKAFQWIQVPASTTKATIFYGVDNYVINFASIIFMLAYLLISWPACFIIEIIGIRKAILWASLGTIVGSAIKCFSCYENGIILLLLGQVVIALSEQLVMQIPTRLASVWFPDDQVSSCNSICIFGNQFGVAFGFWFSPWLLRNATTSDELGEQFFKLFLSTLIYSSALFVLNYLLFDEQPKHAPGAARQRQIVFEMAQQQAADQSLTSGYMDKLGSLYRRVSDLYKNRDLVLLALSFGISLGRSDTILTLLDQMFVQIFPDGAAVFSNVGFLIIVFGAFGSPVWGRIIDKLRIYKTINLVIAACTTLTLALFVYVLLYVKSVMAIYMTAALFGFFQTGFFVASFELAVELTYPAPEIYTSSILQTMGALLGPIFILIASYVVDNFGALPTNMFYMATLLASAVCLICIREQLNRQEAIALQAREKDYQLRFEKQSITVL